MKQFQAKGVSVRDIKRFAVEKPRVKRKRNFTVVKSKVECFPFSQAEIQPDATATGSSRVLHSICFIFSRQNDRLSDMFEKTTSWAQCGSFIFHKT